MMVPVKMNNSLVVDFVLGTGSTEVTLSPDVAYSLYRTNTLSDGDIFMGGPFLDANGLLNEGVKFTIKEMQIGSATIKNIPAGISKAGTEGSILGLNALTKLGKVEVDFRNNILKQGR
jgi:predicted aspartyl protease